MLNRVAFIALVILQAFLAATAMFGAIWVIPSQPTVVAFPALFWGGIHLWRRHPLGYVAGGIVLLKAAAEGLTLVLQTWATIRMGGPGDPLVPVYAIVGLGGLALLVAFLRGAEPARSLQSTAPTPFPA